VVLFALLAIMAPPVDAPLAGDAFEAYVSAPADPQSDTAALVGTALSVAEDHEEEADQDEATFLALATLHCAPDADYQATDAWLSSFPRASAHSCTGPPIL
jgi:hypothetical protein